MTGRPWIFTNDDGVELVTDPCECMVAASHAGSAYLAAIAVMLRDHSDPLTDCEGGDEAEGKINGQPARLVLTWKLTLTN